LKFPTGCNKKEAIPKKLLVLLYLALRPGGPHHRNAIAPFSISLCSISAFGGTEKVKIAYAVTGIFSLKWITALESC
jgi:hypothetical protein